MPLMITSPTGQLVVVLFFFLQTDRSRTYFAGPKFGFGDCVIWGTIRSGVIPLAGCKDR